MRSTITQAGEHVRATVWTEHGTSSKTFQTVTEARAWIGQQPSRRPARRA